MPGIVGEIDTVAEWVALLAWAVGALGTLGALVTYFVKYRGAVKRAAVSFRRFSTALLGRDEIVDIVSGDVLAPAVPSIAERLHQIERSSRESAAQLTALVRISEEQAALQEKVVAVVNEQNKIFSEQQLLEERVAILEIRVDHLEEN